jgi:hypothetical protein
MFGRITFSEVRLVSNLEGRWKIKIRFGLISLFLGRFHFHVVRLILVWSPKIKPQV